MEDFKPTGTPEAPLSKAVDWVRYSETAKREINTMPQWAGSCWYYLRYCDPKNSERFIGKDAESYWLTGSHGAVDLYVGGTEHAVLHLLYARFWHKVLFDLGYLSTREPFQRLVNPGMVLGPGQPEDVEEPRQRDHAGLGHRGIRRGRAASLRDVHGPARADEALEHEGRRRRLPLPRPRLASRHGGRPGGQLEPFAEPRRSRPHPAQLRVAHETIKKVTKDIEGFAFNTAISQMMVFTNEFVNADQRPLAALRILLSLLSPFAPHLAEELWTRLGFEGRASTQPWPIHDEKYLVLDEVEYVVQVNGKLRDRLTIKKDAPDSDVEAAALASPKVQEGVTGKTVAKVIVVKNKLVNIVVK